jgi:hypothetical protein
VSCSSRRPSTGDSVTEGIETVEEAVTALEEIVDQIEEANTGTQSIDEVRTDQAASIEESTRDCRPLRAGDRPPGGARPVRQP